ncbi:hypothetical protein JAAARDRAFT_55334 [Jaapia argillacea MUCL 33604]|uniref:Uncharacterized protein n=1 Tax=Jaapia argillacea MUCL 33604 TaxID=933084 RepID=A0A067QDC2_9AGAM|nr:hypothetical protein JAAARDRAFT_55334 [Jaapia argillacea MUCL 33604]
MVETIDAPMMDYTGDNDVSMHGGSTQDQPWFRSESLMDDDGLMVDQDIDHESVEVDMEAYDAEGVEYEMVDDPGEDSHLSGDVVDVEVYDVSQAPSPNMPAVVDLGYASTHDIAREAKTHHHIDVEANVPRTPPLETPLDSHQFNFGDQSLNHELPTDDRPDSAPSGILDFSQAEPVAPTREGAHTVSHSPSESPHPVAPGVSATDGSHSLLPSTELAGANDQAKESQSIPDFGQNGGPSEVATQHSSERATEHPVLEDHSSQSPKPNDVGIYPEDNPGGPDPHEISEGVYIDPPPAVILSWSSKPDDPEIQCTLFNYPPSGSGSRSPAPGSCPPADVVLLLHQRPTLYYEPLSVVFEALREVEMITDLPYLEEGELMMDAYDLRLSISEDNVYSREVTLHDLNILHDGSGFSGPLRLRLVCTTPRFIVRYHEIQDQVARLNLVGSGEGLVPRQEEVPETGEVDDNVPTEETQPTEPEFSAPPDPDFENQEDKQDDEKIYEHAAAEDDGSRRSEHGNSGDEDHEERGTVPEYENDVAHPDDDFADEDNLRPSLDSDVVHDSSGADNEEYTEYQDYEAPREDDEDDFGEDLPEELGGFGGDVDDQPPEHGDVAKVDDPTEDKLPESVSAAVDEVELSAGPDNLHQTASSDGLFEDEHSFDTPEFDPHDTTEEGVAASSADFTNPQLTAIYESNHLNLIEKESFDETPSNEAEAVDDDTDRDSAAKLTAYEDGDEPQLEDFDEQDDWAEDTLDDEDDTLRNPEPDATSAHSSHTLSSKTSKRSFDQVDLNDEPDNDDVSPPSSPDPKRLRKL